MSIKYDDFLDAIVQGDMLRIVLYVREHGIENACNPTNQSFLHAIIRGKIDSIVTLANLGADVNTTYPTEHGKTQSALTLAVQYRSLDVIQLLLDLGARPRHRREPLYIAMQRGDVDIALFLRDKGFPMPSNKQIQFIFKEAIKNSIRGVVNTMLSLGIDANMKLGPGKVYPLTLAVNCGHSSIATLLIQNGANVNAKMNSIPAIHLALLSATSDPKWMTLIRQFFEHGVDINYKLANGGTFYSFLSTLRDNNLRHYISYMSSSCQEVVS